MRNRESVTAGIIHDRKHIKEQAMTRFPPREKTSIIYNVPLGAVMAFALWAAVSCAGEPVALHHDADFKEALKVLTPFNVAMARRVEKHLFGISTLNEAQLRSIVSQWAEECRDELDVYPQNKSQREVYDHIVHSTIDSYVTALLKASKERSASQLKNLFKPIDVFGKQIVIPAPGNSYLAEESSFSFMYCKLDDNPKHFFLEFFDPEKDFTIPQYLEMMTALYSVAEEGAKDPDTLFSEVVGINDKFAANWTLARYEDDVKLFCQITFLVKSKLVFLASTHQRQEKLPDVASAFSDLFLWRDAVLAANE